MNEINLLVLLAALAAVCASLAAVVVQRRKTKQIMKRLHRMLDLAMDGSFKETTFDESVLSAVESRLYRYLTACAVSARNVAAEKEKIKELLSDISHQTKTPIANILLYAQLLEEQNLPGEGMTCAVALRGQAEKLSFLIASLMKLSRLETGVFTLHPAVHDVAPMLQEAARQMMPDATQKNILLLVDTTAASAVFDCKWTVEALCNVLDNAVKYTPAGGKIHLSVKEYDLFCRINVSDTGIGISEAEQAKVFSRFYRSSAVSGQEGVGIGLYLARRILTGQGGYIKVASTPGSGTVFSMFLPREA